MFPAQDAHEFSGTSFVAGALKLVQIPAGARHIQIEELEKVPHHIGEYGVLGDRQPAPETCHQVWGSWENGREDSNVGGHFLNLNNVRECFFVD